MKFVICLAFCVIAVTASSIGANIVEVPDEFGNIKTVNIDEEIVSPTFDPSADVRFYVFTPANPLDEQLVRYDDRASVAASNFDPNRPTKFVVHGWLSNSNVFLNTLTTAAYMQSRNVNVIVVDWSEGAININYITSRRAVNDVGGVIANFLDNLSDWGMLPNFNSITCIGQSLGAHVCGAAGKRTTRGRINTIFGLDPAGPLFSLGDVANRLDAGDAEYVEIMHTDIVALGIADPIGHADFYPNGGTNQPGCTTTTCDHAIAANYFADSINNNRMWGRRCTNQAQALARACTGEGFYMGGEPSNHRFTLRGIFFLPTNPNSPFGVGVF